MPSLTHAQAPFRVYYVVFLTLVLPIALAVGDDSILRVGIARADITPNVKGKAPVWIAGYGQNRRATGVHDPLYATALVLGDGQRQMALVSVDLVGLQYPDVQRIRKKLVGFDYVLVSSTHNHEGPDVIGIWGRSPVQSGVDPDYVDSVVDKACQSVRQARQNMRPVTASYGVARVPADWLRDTRKPIVRDDALRVIVFRDPDSHEPAGLLVQYSCHPESLASRNTEITADFPAATIDTIQKNLGCPVAYFSGAVGGLMTHPKKFTDSEGSELRDGSFEYATAYGQAIASVAEQAAAGARPVKMTPLRVASMEIAIPLANPLYAAARLVGVLKREMIAYTGDWRDVSATADVDAEKIALKTEVACLALGQVMLAAIPGEIYPELVYGRYQEPADPAADFPESPLEPTVMDSMHSEYPLIVGLANDEIGYIIPRRQWDQLPPYAYGREGGQYGEVNSCGPDVAPILMEAFRGVTQLLRDGLPGRR